MLCSFRHGWIQESSNIIMNLSLFTSQPFSLWPPHSLANSLWAVSPANSGFIFQQPLQEDGTSFPVIAENVLKLVLVNLLWKQGRVHLSYTRTWAEMGRRGWIPKRIIRFCDQRRWWVAGTADLTPTLLTLCPGLLDSLGVSICPSGGYTELLSCVYWCKIHITYY